MKSKVKPTQKRFFIISFEYVAGEKQPFRNHILKAGYKELSAALLEFERLNDLLSSKDQQKKGVAIFELKNGFFYVPTDKENKVYATDVRNPHRFNLERFLV